MESRKYFLEHENDLSGAASDTVVTSQCKAGDNIQHLITRTISSHCHETETDDVDQVTRLGVMTGDTVCVVVN